MKRLVVIPVALALLVGAMVWRSPIAGNAATINGHGITTKQINNELSAIAASPSFYCYLNGLEGLRTQVVNGHATGLPPVNGSATSNSYSTAFAAQWLSQQIDAASVSQWNAAHGVTVTDADLDTAHAALTLSITETYAAAQSDQQFACNADPSTVLATLPPWFQHQLVVAQANSTAMIHAVAADQLTTPGLEAYFASHKSSFGGLCISVIIAPDQLTANTYVNAIKGGASFEQIAKDHSLDSQSAPNGGAYGCVGPASSNYSQFLRLVGSTPPGELAPIVSLSGGRYAIIRVDSRGNPTFDSVRGQVAAAVLNGAVLKTRAINQRNLRTSNVSVNAAYGTWHTATSIEVLPPVGPPKSSLLKPSA